MNTFDQLGESGFLCAMRVRCSASAQPIASCAREISTGGLRANADRSAAAAAQRGTERAARLDWGAPAEDVQGALNALTLTDARVDIAPVGANPSFQPHGIIRSSCWTAPSARYRGASRSVGGYVWSITFSRDVWRDPTVEHPDDGDFDGNWVAADWDDTWSTGVSMEWGKNTGDMPSISCVDSGLYLPNGVLPSDGCLVEEFLKGTEPVGGYFAVSLDTTGHSVINRQGVFTSGAIRHNAFASVAESGGDGSSMEEMLEAMPNVGDITVTRSAVNEGGNNGGFTWTVTFLRDAGSNGYGQFGDCEQRGTVDNLCNSPGDTDGVRGGLEWRVAFLENPGSYDGYTYPPGAGNLDSITYDTSSLQGTTPAVVNEVLRTGSTPFSGTFSVAFNGAKTEEMERQEATDEVDYGGAEISHYRVELDPTDTFDDPIREDMYCPTANKRTVWKVETAGTGATNPIVDGTFELTLSVSGQSYTTDPIPYDAVGSAFDETGVYETLVEGSRREGEVYRVSLLDPSGTTFNLTSPATDEARIFLGTSKTTAKVTRGVHGGRGTSATSEVFCEDETGYCSSGGRLDFLRLHGDYNGTIGGAGASVKLTQWQAGETYSDCTGVSHVVPSDVSGLQNGLLYYYTAISSVGYSLPQATDSAMKPLRVQFSSPAWDGGGHEITSYLVEYAMDVAFASTESVTGYGTPQSTAPSSAAPYEESGAPSDVELGITSDSMLTIGHAYPPPTAATTTCRRTASTGTRRRRRRRRVVVPRRLGHVVELQLALRVAPLTVKDVDGSGWFYSGEPAYALSIGGVGNLSACAEWEHPCSTRRRSECLAWDAEDYEVEEQIDLFMSEFLDVADGVTGTRKTDVANAPSGYAYSLVGVSQPPTIYVDESNCSARPFSDDNDEHVVADVVSAGALLPLGSSAFSGAFDEALGDQPAMLADGTYLAGGVVATVVDDVVQGSAATGIVLESLHAGVPRGVRVAARNELGSRVY
ncbi:RNA polymerase II transcription regulator recruiting protein [Aureococcus anophagefferens]|nr:RNA polymerase II transcription regulator recruiting protein [Aureococcus anophagefferens]